MTFNEWLHHGAANGYLQAHCITHDMLDMYTQEETERFNNGEDPCSPRWVIPHHLAHP